LGSHLNCHVMTGNDVLEEEHPNPYPAIGLFYVNLWKWNTVQTKIKIVDLDLPWEPCMVHLPTFTINKSSSDTPVPWILWNLKKGLLAVEVGSVASYKWSYGAPVTRDGNPLISGHFSGPVLRERLFFRVAYFHPIDSWFLGPACWWGIPEAFFLVGHLKVSPF